MIVLVQPFERGLAVQAKHRREKDNAFDQRGDRSASVCFWLNRGTRDRLDILLNREQRGDLLDLVLEAVGSKLVQ